MLNLLSADLRPRGNVVGGSPFPRPPFSLPFQEARGTIITRYLGVECCKYYCLLLLAYCVRLLEFGWKKISKSFETSGKSIINGLGHSASALLLEEKSDNGHIIPPQGPILRLFHSVTFSNTLRPINRRILLTWICNSH